MIASLYIGPLHTQGPRDLTYRFYKQLQDVLGTEKPAVGHFFRWEYPSMPGLYLMDNPKSDTTLEVHTPEAELFVLTNLPEGLSLCYVST